MVRGFFASFETEVLDFLEGINICPELVGYSSFDWGDVDYDEVV